MTDFAPKHRRRSLLLAVWFLWTATAGQAATNWFADAVWYQIFPERFRNGDPSNDPVRASLFGTWPYTSPEDWQVSPWTSDWYEFQPWERDGHGFYHHAQLRRYGGDLQGIIDQLDYLKELGVNALYLNPVFESPSLHKYGAAMFHHIDKHFGPDPEGDLKLFATEDPADPATWQWSAADRLFLKLIEEVHRRDMRIIIDGVFNHVGIPFWALERARREGPDSRFAKWFMITRWDDPATPEDEFEYKGWSGIRDLPELARDEENLYPEVREYFRAIVRRWMDPNGDGDPSDGIDGWRLDVAAEVPMGFWRELRGWVKAINPQAFLTGEIWWDDYRNHKYKNARPWLDDAFDSVMNYRFGDAVYQFFNQPDPIPATKFAGLLRQLHEDYGYERSLEQQNLFGSHDTSRIGSAVVNPTHRQGHGASLQPNPDYDVTAPNPSQKQRWQQMVAFQFLAPGAPYVYYGDEAGMWGANDPDCRKPMLWPDLVYQTERAHPHGRERTLNAVSPDAELRAFYQQWIALRNQWPVLRRGDFKVIQADDAKRIFAFQRTLEGITVVAVFNASGEAVSMSLAQLGLGEAGGWSPGFTSQDDAPPVLAIGAHSFALLRRK